MNLDEIMPIPDDPDDDDLDAQALKGRLNRIVNLTPAQLRSFRESKYNDAYLDQNSSGAQPGNEPLNDIIRLIEKPWYDWTSRDKRDAQEALNWWRRHGTQMRSRGLGDNFLTDEKDMQKSEASAIRWGRDPDDDREWL